MLIVIIHPRTLLLLKLPPIFSSPRPITFYTGTAVAVAARALWVGGPLCDLHETLSLLPFVSVTHYNMDYYSLTDPGGMEG